MERRGLLGEIVALSHPKAFFALMPVPVGINRCGPGNHARKQLHRRIVFPFFSLFVNNNNGNIILTVL